MPTVATATLDALSRRVWIIKILCTTVGETAADFLNVDLGFGLNNTTYVTGALLLATLGFQFKATRYVPGVYWSAVVLLSVVGTLITDNLTDNFGVSLVTSTIGFSTASAVAFAVWFASERTLSIHTIITRRREGFYWLAILFTFALGTAAGDLFAEKLSVGYWPSALLFGGVIAAITPGQSSRCRFDLAFTWRGWGADPRIVRSPGDAK